MKVTIVGCGDAFGSGGRAHTCFRLDTGGKTVLVDFGASSLGAWNKLGLDVSDIDAIVVSHLHGDHFGGLPFLLLECQFVARRKKPLTLIGPPGFAKRLESLLEIFFPGSAKTPWSFAWKVQEILARRVTKLAGLELETFEVLHPSGGLSTGLRLSDGVHTFAYSGDTAWTDTLYEVAAAADLFIVECFSGDVPVPHHMDWPTLAAKLPSFTAKRIVVTHMGDTAFACASKFEAAGLIVAKDGQSFDI